MMAEKSREWVLERYKNLLALAEDRQGTPEGAVAQKFAEEHRLEWDISPTELVLVGRSGRAAQAEVELGGRPEERYRETYRAALLAVLADMAGCTATYNPATWKGKIFGDPKASAEVSKLYSELVQHYDRKFFKWWIKNRFTAKGNKASSARSWFVNLVHSLLDLHQGSPRVHGVFETKSARAQAKPNLSKRDWSAKPSATKTRLRAKASALAAAGVNQEQRRPGDIRGGPGSGGWADAASYGVLLGHLAKGADGELKVQFSLRGVPDQLLRDIVALRRFRGEAIGELPDYSAFEGAEQEVHPADKVRVRVKAKSKRAR